MTMDPQMAALASTLDDVLNGQGVGGDHREYAFVLITVSKATNQVKFVTSASQETAVNLMADTIEQLTEGRA